MNVRISREVLETKHHKKEVFGYLDNYALTISGTLSILEN